jgi:hypothetical protein
MNEEKFDYICSRLGILGQREETEELRDFLKKLERNTRKKTLRQLKEKNGLIQFFLFFRENGEKYLGLTIEEFVDLYLKQK